MWKYIGLFTFKSVKIKYNEKPISLITLAVFQVLNSYMWLVASLLYSTAIEHSHNHRKFCWIMLL